ncbi:MAG: hypothetical protein ACRD1P_04045, partial [Thermoanaerobaculia bacterium]
GDNLYNYVMPRMSNAMTKAEVRQLALHAIRLGAPMSFTAGEVTTALHGAGHPQLTRDAVDRALKDLRSIGEVRCELKPVTRNGIRIPNAAHYYAPRAGQGQAPGCDSCDDCRAGQPCGVMAAFQEAEGMIGRR